MNLESYQRQVYNLGSPQPTAKRNFAETFPLNKPLSSASKRKFAPDEDTESRRAKMVKVGDMELDELAIALKAAFKEDFDKIKQDIEGVRSDMEKDRQDVSNLATKVETVETNLLSLQRQVDDMATKQGANVEQVKEAVLPDVQRIVLSEVNAQWKDTLASEVRQCEDKLIVYGLEWQASGPVKALRTFCKDKLKMDTGKADSMPILEVVKLGNGKNGRPAPQMVKLSNASDRNDCLKLSHNLPKGFGLDKCVPKRYEEKYKVFKSQAWKLRTAKNMNTFIGFDRYAMQLKIKKKDDGDNKYDWTIYNEYIPKPSKSSPSKKPAEPRDGLLPTQPLSDADTETICILSGLKNVREAGNIANEIQEFVVEKDLECIENIMPTSKSCAILSCKDRTSAVDFSKKYNGTLHKGQKLSVQIFSPRK